MKEAKEAILKKATKGKVLVGDLLKEAGDNKDVVLKAIEELSKMNDIRVFKDKDTSRLTIRASKKFDADLTRFPGATEEMIKSFLSIKFNDQVYVEDISTGKKYTFQVVKIAGRSFAAVYTPDGKEAGFVKYLSSTKHPWSDTEGEKKVLLFTTIGESRSLIVDGVSFWGANDTYQSVFAPMVKDGFKMASMSKVTKFVMSKINASMSGNEKTSIQRSIIDIRSFAKWDSAEIDQAVEIGDGTYTFYKTAGSELQVLDSNGQTVAKGFYRGWKATNNMFESNVELLMVVPDNQAFIQTVTDEMKKLSEIPLNRGFENL